MALHRLGALLLQKDVRLLQTRLSDLAPGHSVRPQFAALSQRVALLNPRDQWTCSTRPSRAPCSRTARSGRRSRCAWTSRPTRRDRRVVTAGCPKMRLS